MQLGFIVLGALLCAFSAGVAAAAASSLHANAVPHILGSNPVNDTLKPLILKFVLSKDGVAKGSCYGVLLSSPRVYIRHYGILPAQCLDKTKYDMIEVDYGYNDLSSARFLLKYVQIAIHPKYNAATKANNIGLVGLPNLSYYNLENGFSTTRLPSISDMWDEKTLELYELKRDGNDSGQARGTILQSFKTTPVSSIWCKILYLFSFMNDAHMCVAGKFRTLTQDDLGVPLVARDGDSLKLVGIVTIIRSWASLLAFPIEVTRIQPYLEWIKDFSGDLNSPKN